MRINFSTYSNQISFQSSQNIKKEGTCYAIKADPKEVQEYCSRYGINATAKKYGVVDNTVKRFLKRNNLMEGRKYDGRQILKVDKVGVTVEEVRDKIRAGEQIKNIAQHYGISTTTLEKFIKLHSDQLNYKQMREDARKEVLSSCFDSIDAAEKLMLNKNYARNLLRQFKCGNRPIKEVNRERRLETAIPLYKKGRTVKYIAETLGCNEITIKRDLEYYLSQQNSETNKENTDTNNDTAEN